MKRKIVSIAMFITLVTGAAACGGHGDAADEKQQGGTTTVAPDGTDKEAGTFGTLEKPVCGPGDAKGATDQGVTDSSIKIGTLSDAGNTILPGLLSELFESADAFVSWCNAAGGINGRKIELVKRDTKLIEGQQRIAEACTEDFMLVGGASGLDGPLAEPRAKCGLPNIPALAADVDAQAGELQAQVIPNYPDYIDVTMARLVKDKFPEVVDHYGVVALAASKDQRSDLASDGTTQIGFKTVYKGNFPPPPATVDNWRPYVQEMKSSGVEVLDSYIIADHLVPIMNTMADVGWKPTLVQGNAGQYSSTLIKGNDALGEVPTWVPTYTTPFELADSNPPIKQFLDIMDESQPGWSKNPKALAVQGFSGWLLFAQAATACGSDLTRECVMKEAAATGEWDGGGITAPNEVATDATKAPKQKCIAVVKATPEGFEYDKDFTQPNNGVFHCAKDGWVKRTK